jgi:hypothetical protein
MRSDGGDSSDTSMETEGEEEDGIYMEVVFTDEEEVDSCSEDGGGSYAGSIHTSMPSLEHEDEDPRPDPSDPSFSWRNWSSLLWLPYTRPMPAVEEEEFISPDADTGELQ